MSKPTSKQQVEPEVDSDSDSSDDEDYVPDDKVEAQSEGEDDSDDSEKGHSDNEGASDHNITRSGKRRNTGGEPSSLNKKQKPEEPIDEAEAQIRKSKLDALWAEMNTPLVRTPESRKLDLNAATLAQGGAITESSRMVTITTTYEFAGETVTVTKDVPENSKEAMEEAKKHSVDAPSIAGIDSVGATPTSSTLNAASSASSNTPPILSNSGTSSSSPVSKSSTSTSGAPTTKRPTTITRPSILDSLAKKAGPVRYVRKKSNLDALAATYGVKKPAKLNTLEKSKLDWNNFVGKEGIEDELKHHNKDGYMEKVAFLQRTDERRDQEYQRIKKMK